ncbi:ATP-dependent DNA helicase [Trichonephila clavipes]|nr:ATP-dependent DNA helicase [Trichonephila clavipes]
MLHKAAFEALDVTLQDLRSNNKRMGGITLVLAGDFCQTCQLFHVELEQMKYLHFADNLLQLGNGSFASLGPDGAVSFKNIGRIVKTEEELLQAVSKFA